VLCRCGEGEGEDVVAQDTAPLPCDPRPVQQNTVELKNMKTKLYFVTPYAGNAPTVAFKIEDGIEYRMGSVWLNCPDFEGKSIGCYICNFPDYALSWNLKNEQKPLGDVVVEGELDVIISGKIYADSELEGHINGALELTSLVALHQDTIAIPYVEYSLAGTSCQWANLGCDGNVIVVNSRAELERHVTCAEGSFSEIDFAKNTLLIACGGTTNGIQYLSKKFFFKKNLYTLEIDITLDDATVSENWTVALATDKMSATSKVELHVIAIRS
jgi:hypothetical protein